MDRGVTHAIDLDLVMALTDAFDRLGRDEDVHGVVLTGSGRKFFSIGFDLPRLIELDRAGFGDFYHRFNLLCVKIHTLRKPVVAAVNGHAIAGGCILALCCDYRFIAENRTLTGLNEIKLGVPVPYPADCMLRRLVGERVARDIMESGDFYPADQALKLGLVDQALPADRVLSGSVGRAELLSRLPAGGRVVIKRNRTESIERRILSRLEEKERLFLDCWFSETTRIRLEKAAEKF